MKFTYTFQVSREDIDDLGHVNNVVYVRYVQEAATAHWAAIATAEMQEQSAWVVLRHEIDYLSPAFEGDTLEASTWVGDTRGPRSERFVEIQNKNTGKPILRAKTTWCMLDGNTMKPRRVDEEIIRLLKTDQ